MRYCISTLILGFLLTGCTGEPDSLMDDRVTDIFSDIYISKETDLYASAATGEKADGHYTEYFDNGELKADLKFKNGNVIEGQIRYENSEVHVQYEMDPESEFVNRTTYNEGGVKLWENVLEPGNRLPREFTHWYKDGTPKSKVTPDEITAWYENGVKKETAEYSNGNLDGRVAKWYENGQLAGESFYVDNKLHGDYREWDEEGTLMNSKTYDMGERVEE